jgi:hypothetical protein
MTLKPISTTRRRVKGVSREHSGNNSQSSASLKEESEGLLLWKLIHIHVGKM